MKNIRSFVKSFAITMIISMVLGGFLFCSKSFKELSKENLLCDELLSYSLNSEGRRYVCVSGKPFVMKPVHSGVVLTGFLDVLTCSGYVNPAKEAGLMLDDVLTYINDVKINEISDVVKALGAHSGEVLEISYIRNGQNYQTVLNLARGRSGNDFGNGMCLSELDLSCVGTMTFIDLESGFFAGLGHKTKVVSNQHNFDLKPIQVIPVSITGVEKSENGCVGSLNVSETVREPCGEVRINNSNGIYGYWSEEVDGELMPVAFKNEIKKGTAYLVATISGEEPQQYEIEIINVTTNARENETEFDFKITDEKLLSVTGGVVEGMSGCPILQEGKLIGSVSGVYLELFEYGYGVFAWSMLENIDDISARYEIKE